SVRANGYFDKYVAVVETGVALEDESEIVTDANEIKWLRQQVTSIGEGIAITTRDISPRKRAELENRNSHAFSQSLIDHLPVLIYVRDMRENAVHRMLVWNRKAEETTGYLARDVLGKSDREVFPGDMVDAFDRIEHKIRQNPQVTDIPEIAFRRADGGLRYIHVTTVPLYDNSLRLEYLLGIAEDITSRREQDLALRTKQAELTAANDASPLGLFRTGPKGDCTYVNRTYEEMSGLTAEQAMGDGWVKAICPEDRLKVFQSWGQSSRTQQPYQGVYRFRHADGRVVWVSMKTSPILVDGDIQGHVGSVDDITARRAADQELSKSEQRLRTITDTLPALVAYIGADERYRFNNRAYETAFGVDRSAILGKTVREFVGETNYRQIAQYVRRALGGERVTFEQEELRGGFYRYMESTFIPQFADDGNAVVGFNVMIQDVTDKKLEERRLLQLAQVDGLTGLMNRTGFEQKLFDAMTASRGQHSLMALMYLDIDRFKNINDTRGHLVGDALLKAFAARLARTLRSVDTIARLGGDEFTVIMEGLAKPDDAVTVAAKIVQSMKSLFSLEGVPVAVSASVGVAFYQGGDGDPKSLIGLADAMLYQSKAAGRNTYSVAPLGDDHKKAGAQF
ncbi:MAG: PAS domain S-box protein, partial [Herminiimonas sp.]|nr:PAS domain S-box protein [Herminiimonas sp.]